MADVVDLNKYVYGAASPITNFDPSGFVTLNEMNIAVNTVTKERQANTRHASINAKRIAQQMCSAAAGAVRILNNTYAKVRKITACTANQAHHGMQDAVMQLLFTAYKRNFGCTIPLLGGSKSRGSPHDLANTMQRILLGKNPEYVAYASLKAAGCRNSDATEIMTAVKNWNELNGWHWCARESIRVN